MKKFLLICLAILLASCGGNEPKANTTYDEIVEVPVDTLKEREKAMKFMESMGIEKMFFDKEGYFVYYYNPEDIHTDGNWVAQQMYDLISEVPGLRGVKIISLDSTEVLGQYSSPIR